MTRIGSQNPDRPLSHTAIALIVFFAGTITMTLELVGSRLLAPYFGNSLFVWTALIGVMLGFMSLGYYLGGRLADRTLSVGVLFWIIIGAAFTIALAAFSEAWLLPALVVGGSSRIMMVLAAVLLFAIPSTLMGMVPPYCIRMRLEAIADSGTAVGSLYALSTVGSIVGTFATGFWLLSLFGTHAMLLLLATALTLLAAAVLLVSRFDLRRISAIALVVLVVLAGFASTGIADTLDTDYDRYFVRDIVEGTTGRPVTVLSRDMRGAESASFADSGEPFPFPYYDYYDLGAELAGDVDRVLMIGGGTFSYPRLFVERHPAAVIDAVEIDPALYDLAKMRFGYRDDSRIAIHLEDGRVFLNESEAAYDAIFVDAFKSEQTVPYQLVTREVWDRCFALTRDGGTLVINVIADPEGDRSEFLQALYTTIAEVYPDVEVYPVQDDAINGLKNSMIVAMKSPAGAIEGALAEVAPEVASRRATMSKGPVVFTDDFAPVDQYLLGF